MSKDNRKGAKVAEGARRKRKMGEKGWRLETVGTRKTCLAATGDRRYGVKEILRLETAATRTFQKFVEQRLCDSFAGFASLRFLFQRE